MEPVNKDKIFLTFKKINKIKDMSVQLLYKVMRINKISLIKKKFFM